MATKRCSAKYSKSSTTLYSSRRISVTGVSRNAARTYGVCRHDVPHIYTIPKVSVNAFTPATISAIFSVNGASRASGIFGINS